MPYLTVDPLELRPGDRIPDATTDGPTVTDVVRPDADPPDTLMLLVRFAEEEGREETARDVYAGKGRMGVYIWRPDEEHPTADTEQDPARRPPA